MAYKMAKDLIAKLSRSNSNRRRKSTDCCGNARQSWGLDTVSLLPQPRYPGGHTDRLEAGEEEQSKSLSKVLCPCIQQRLCLT